MKSAPLKTFIIYARADAPFKDELLEHLHPLVENEFIERWVDSDLLPGEDWEKRIEQELEAAHLVIILVSATALRSEFIQKKELKTALEKKRGGNARVIPILVRDCAWDLYPQLSEIQLLPKDESGNLRGVAAWLSRDSAWTYCVRELKKLVDEIRQVLAKEAAEQARKDALALEAAQQKEAAEKREKNRHRIDEATWKKILADAEKTADPAQKMLCFEAYLDDDTHQNHREAAAEEIEALQAEITAARKVEAARAAARQKQEATERAEAELKVRETEAVKAAQSKGLPDMVLVKGGTFQMGDKDIAAPIHPVTLSDFEIGKYPVTQKLWTDLMGTNPSNFKGDDLPVETVSWEDVQSFFEKLNARHPGKNYRLPTEAEWEFAARGGTLSKGYTYAGSNDLKEVGWFWENSGDKPLSGEWESEKLAQNNCHTHLVGQKKANELGLYEMSGNVWEWCADRYAKYEYSKKPVYNPTGPVTGSRRVGRGGSWYNESTGCHVAVRRGWRLDSRYINLGFRLARTY